MSFPIIETKRIILRELEEKDSLSLFSVFSNTQAMKYWDSSCHTNISTTMKFLEKMRRSFQNEQGISWGIVLKASNELIGQISFHSLSSCKSEGQLGYIISPRHWGYGIGDEVLSAIIIFGFNVFGLKEIFAEIDPDNLPSISIIEKHGFELIEFRENDLIIDGESHNTNLYRLANGYV